MATQKKAKPLTTEERQHLLKYWRITLVLAFIALLSSYFAKLFFLADTLSVGAQLSFLVTKSLPLAVFLPWLLKPNYKASLFFTLVVMLYFSYSAISLFAQGLSFYFALIESCLFLILFIAAFRLGKLH